MIERMIAEDEAKSARVLAVLHAKDAEIAEMAEACEALRGGGYMAACCARAGSVRAMNGRSTVRRQRTEPMLVTPSGMATLVSLVLASNALCHTPTRTHCRRA